MDTAVRTTGLLTAGRNRRAEGTGLPAVDDRRQQRSFRRSITPPVRRTVAQALSLGRALFCHWRSHGAQHSHRYRWIPTGRQAGKQAGSLTPPRQVRRQAIPRRVLLSGRAAPPQRGPSPHGENRNDKARLFLGLFALALLLPLLLLACGGSDEPTDAPSSERATAEPESRASSGQTTAEPTTASAEPSPTPRATAAPTKQRVLTPSTPRPTARPPMAQTPPETDREALVALYNATGGPYWDRNDNWLSDVPISEWEGVTTDDNDSVTSLFLGDNQLSGEIPPELGNLSNLSELVLIDNQLSGEIPSELGNLASLTGLHLHENQLSGEIPSELGNLASLTGFSSPGTS